MFIGSIVSAFSIFFQSIFQFILNPNFVCVLYLFFINFFICRFFGFWLGKRGVVAVVNCNLILSIFVICINSYKFLVSENSLSQFKSLAAEWFSVSTLDVEFAFFLDPLSCTMSLMVIIITVAVIFYSYDYMATDPFFIRFVGYLNLFAFFMLVLIYSKNFFILFLGWEGVGLCSFLLVGFWTTRLQAAKSSLKALLFNRIGDFFLLLGICLCAHLFKSTDYHTIFAVAPYFLNSTVTILSISVSYLELIACCFVFGAVGKSAQIGLHLWLPDAMEGPTPVSALIHAATMVTAGLYLLIRCSFFLILTPNIFYIITILGTCTIVFSSLTALYQFDLKKIIAYSTCSQLGYMFVSIGLTNFTLSYYHLLTHAFFKALLFLSAGSIIHLFQGEQDLRKMGGASKYAPFLYSVFIIGNISLFGFFFTSGFYSKEALLNFIINMADHSYLQYCGTLSLLMTAATILYSMRLFYYSFFNAGFNGFYANYVRLTAPVKFSYEFAVLFFLAFCSVVIGFIIQDLFFENSLFFSSSIACFHPSIVVSDFSSSFIAKLIPFFFLLFILFVYLINPNFFHRIFSLNTYVFRFFSSKFFFDSIFSYWALFGLLWSRRIFFYLDKGFLEIIGPYGLFNFFKIASKNLNFLLVPESLLQHFYYLLTGCFFLFTLVLVMI